MQTIAGAPKLHRNQARQSGAPRKARRAGPANRERLKVVVRGAVQGVGFRPFIYRLATELKLNGWVSNTPQGVFIEVEGAANSLRKFRDRIDTERPPHALVQSLEASFVDAIGYDGFEICE